MTSVSRQGGKPAPLEKAYLSPELEQDIQHRLSRIEGHVRGIGRMLEEHQDCERILVQTAAVKAALNQVIIKLMEGHLEMCVAEIADTGDGSEAMGRLRRPLSTMLKRM